MMRSASRSFLIVVLLFSSVAAQDYTEWIKMVPEPDTMSIRFNCSEFPDNPREAFPANESQVTRWMMPNLTMIEDLDFDDGRVRLENNGWTLVIDEVGKDDLGVYHCMMRTPQDEWYLVKWGLNMRGPYFERLWDKYMWNTIIAICAMAGYLLLVASVYIVYVCQWVAPPGWSDEGEEEMGKRPSLLHGNKVAAYNNTGLLDDDVKVQHTPPTPSASTSSEENISGDSDEEAAAYKATPAHGQMSLTQRNILPPISTADEPEAATQF